MGVCFSICEPRSRPSTSAEPYFTSNPWDRKLPERENPDALPRYYRDKVAREAINRRKKARLKRQAAALKAEGKNPREEQANVQPGGADMGLPKLTHPVQFTEFELDDRPEGVV